MPAPLRVLHVTFDMRIGGTEQVIRNLIEASAPAQTTMSIFCIEEPLGPWGKALRGAGTPVESVHRRPGFDLRVIAALRRHLRRERIDVLHCHQYTPWVYGCLAALGTGAAVIFTEHGRFHPDRASPKRRWINPVLGKLTDHITAISQATRQALVDYEYLPARRIEVVYNGIHGLKHDPAAVAALKSDRGIPMQAPVLGTIARFDPIKNHRMMLLAFRQVLDRHPQARLLLVGDGEERGNIEAQIDELSLRDHVILPGYIPNPTAWLDAMDVFLLPSFSEGTSMTLLEAMSLGKPAVVTDVGGNPEIVLDGKTGLVTPSDEANRYAGAICELLADGKRCAAMGAAARQRFEAQFASRAMAEAYLARYGSAAPPH